MDPCELAISFGATWVGRGFSGDPKTLVDLMTARDAAPRLRVPERDVPLRDLARRRPVQDCSRRSSPSFRPTTTATDRAAALRYTRETDVLTTGVLYEVRQPSLRRADGRGPDARRAKAGARHEHGRDPAPRSPRLSDPGRPSFRPHGSPPGDLRLDARLAKMVAGSIPAAPTMVSWTEPIAPEARTPSSSGSRPPSSRLLTEPLISSPAARPGKSFFDAEGRSAWLDGRVVPGGCDDRTATSAGNADRGGPDPRRNASRPGAPPGPRSASLDPRPRPPPSGGPTPTASRCRSGPTRSCSSSCAPPTSSRKSSLTGGVTFPTKLLLEKDGVRADAVFRDVDEDRPTPTFGGGRDELYFRDSYIFEPAAYELSRLLGLDNVPPATLRKLDEQERQRADLGRERHDREDAGQENDPAARRDAVEQATADDERVRRARRTTPTATAATSSSRPTGSSG